MRYFCRFDDDDLPMVLFRADGVIEEGWSKQGWIPAPGFLQSVTSGSYGAITEEAAREHFPQAFAAEEP